MYCVLKIIISIGHEPSTYLSCACTLCTHVCSIINWIIVNMIPLTYVVPTIFMNQSYNNTFCKITCLTLKRLSLCHLNNLKCCMQPISWVIPLYVLGMYGLFHVSIVLQVSVIRPLLVYGLCLSCSLLYCCYGDVFSHQTMLCCIHMVNAIFIFRILCIYFPNSGQARFVKHGLVALCQFANEDIHSSPVYTQFLGIPFTKVKTNLGLKQIFSLGL